MDEKITVTVILTVYNGEKFLQEQLDSILNQSYSPIEIAIFDDVSTDKSMDILQSYSAKHPSIKLHQNQSTLGVVKNFEQALSQCKSQYIALSDQDDIWHKDKIQLCMEKMLTYEKTYPNIPLLVHSDLALIDDKEKILSASYFKFRNYDLPDEKALNIIISQNGVMGNTLLLNQSLKEKCLPFPDTLAVHDYWIALVNEIYGKRITIRKPLVSYRLHNSNCSNRIAVIKKNKPFSFQKIFSAQFHLPYMNIGRDKVLKILLQHKDLTNSDREIIENFLCYLTFCMNKWKLFLMMIKYNFLKKNYIYRMKFFFKLMFTQDYLL